MINKSITNTSMEPPESYLDLNLGLGGYDQLAFCDESQALLQQIPWLILLSDQYFVPSLYMIPSFNQEIRKLFPEKETVFYHLGHYLFHPSISHEEYQHFGDDMHNMKAWADIYLLSLCDVLVTSTWSTFGYVAHGLAGLKPWIWQMPRNKNPACQRAMIEVSAATLLPNTMHCEDRKNGLKLVDEHGELLL
ncbi:galactoside alpha-L-fucosyltransferase [Salix suchowensis]|nr:galactoside alpha-L-fucosyltransferase [Salix suchowensis]